MSIFPTLTLPEGETYKPVSYTETGGAGNVTSLSKVATALVTIVGEPDMMHVLNRQEDGSLRAIWPDDGPADIIAQLFEGGYPQFTFPSASMYEHWRSGRVASKDKVDEEYGFIRESWLDASGTGDGTLRDFTAFSAMFRHFGDDESVNHLELRTPTTAYVSGRIPMDECKKILEPDNTPARTGEYAVLWLPSFKMDKSVVKWVEHRVKQRQEAADRQADSDHVDDLLRGLEEEFKEMDSDEEAA